MTDVFLPKIKNLIPAMLADEICAVQPMSMPYFEVFTKPNYSVVGDVHSRDGKKWYSLMSVHSSVTDWILTTFDDSYYEYSINWGRSILVSEEVFVMMKLKWPR